MTTKEIDMVGGALNAQQRTTLAQIASAAPGPYVYANRWTTAASLVRRGLVRKERTVAPLTDPEAYESGSCYHAIQCRSRAAYTLTEAGQALVKSEARS